MITAEKVTMRTTTLIFKAVTNTQVDVVPADAPPGEGPKHQDRGPHTRTGSASCRRTIVQQQGYYQLLCGKRNRKSSAGAALSTLCDRLY